VEKKSQWNVVQNFTVKSAAKAVRKFANLFKKERNTKESKLLRYDSCFSFPSILLLAFWSGGERQRVNKIQPLHGVEELVKVEVKKDNIQIEAADPGTLAPQ
jgi:hypothetical protein